MPRKSSAANAPKRSDSNVRRIIGANIKARRLALDWNQQDLADRFGVSRSAVSQYEIGTGEVNAGDLPRLAQILGLTLLDFYQSPTRETPASEEGAYSGAADRPQTSPKAGGEGHSAKPGAGEQNHTDEWGAILRPTEMFVPTKKAQEVVSVAIDEVNPTGLHNDLSGSIEMAVLFHDMTPLERATVLRIAKALKGTLGA